MIRSNDQQCLQPATKVRSAYHKATIIGSQDFMRCRGGNTEHLGVPLSLSFDCKNRQRSKHLLIG